MNGCSIDNVSDGLVNINQPDLYLYVPGGPISTSQLKGIGYVCDLLLRIYQSVSMLAVGTALCRACTPPCRMSGCSSVPLHIHLMLGIPC